MTSKLSIVSAAKFADMHATSDALRSACESMNAAHVISPITIEDPLFIAYNNAVKVAISAAKEAFASKAAEDARKALSGFGQVFEEEEK